MNIKLDWRSDFLGICAYDDKIFPNHFHVELQMVTKSEDPRFQNVAFERMKILVTEIFGHSIFVGHENPNLEGLGKIYPEKLVILPEEAYDQVIGIALFCKANAVMEQAMICTNVRISSHFGDMVWYQYEQGEDIGPFALANLNRRKKNWLPWWHRPDLLTFDAKGKIQVTTWEDLDLGWEEAEETPTPEKPAEVIDIKKTRHQNFKAEVVNGGKKPNED
jgi:hypothetical protein